jgi:hypothetical protein
MTGSTKLPLGNEGISTTMTGECVSSVDHGHGISTITDAANAEGTTLTDLIRSALYHMGEYVRTDNPLSLESARECIRDVLDPPNDDHLAQDMAVSLYDITCYLEGTKREATMP